jgi:N-acetylglucosamine-6-phosphate deacetylase
MSALAPGRTLRVAGGTVLGSTGALRADVVISGATITTIDGNRSSLPDPGSSAFDEGGPVGPDRAGRAGGAGRASATEVIDATGMIVGPGLIDLQCNGAGGIDLTAQPERLWEVAATLPRWGVTAWLPTIISSPPEITDRALACLRSEPPPSLVPVARPLGLHLEGPFLAPARHGAHDLHHLADPDHDRGRTAGWSRRGGVAMVTLAPELPGALALTAELVARNVVVSLGHSDASLDEALGAVASGATCVTHLFNAMAPLHHRDPGLLGLALTDERLRSGLIADGHHVGAHALSIVFRLLGSRMILVTDSTAALGIPVSGGQTLTLGSEPVTVGADGVRRSGGTLAGSDLSLDQAVRNLVATTGCPLARAVAAASTVPADVLDLTTKGRLVEGADADLVVMSPAGEIVVTVAGGRIAHDVRPAEIRSRRH